VRSPPLVGASKQTFSSHEPRRPEVSRDLDQGARLLDHLDAGVVCARSAEHSLPECPELDLAGGLVDGRKNITGVDGVVDQPPTPGQDSVSSRYQSNPYRSIKSGRFGTRFCFPSPTIR